jgi:phage antirepressor YoqD-like protein
MLKLINMRERNFAAWMQENKICNLVDSILYKHKRNELFHLYQTTKIGVEFYNCSNCCINI